MDWTAKVDLAAIHAKRRKRAVRDDARRKAWLDKRERRRQAREAAGLPPEMPAPAEGGGAEQG